MPQFDPSTYTSQVFWLMVSFAITYAGLSRIILPRIYLAFSTRQLRIENSLRIISEIEEEAKNIYNHAHNLLQQANQKQEGALRQAKEQAASQLLKAKIDVNAMIQEQADKIELEVTQKRQEILDHIEEITVQVQKMCSQKLTQGKSNIDVFQEYMRLKDHVGRVDN